MKLIPLKHTVKRNNTIASIVSGLTQEEAFIRQPHYVKLTYKKFSNT